MPALTLHFVMAGLDPAIHVPHPGASVDARIKSGHDDYLVAGIGGGA